MLNKTPKFQRNQTLVHYCVLLLYKKENIRISLIYICFINNLPSPSTFKIYF